MLTRITSHGVVTRWLPEDPNEIWRYHSMLIKELAADGAIDESAGTADANRFSLAILQFKKVIEDDGEIYRDFHEMFEQVVPRPDGSVLPISNYMLLLAVLNRQIRTAPSYVPVNPLITGVPMYAVISPFCNTPAGYHAFTNDKVNGAILGMFDEWSRFLVSPGSRNVLVTSYGGWLSKTAIDAMNARLAQTGSPIDRTFEHTWVCDPKAPHYGFLSWDDFFVRRFQPQQRAIIDPDNAKIIINPCEAVPYRTASDVHLTDQFWVKEMPYSLQHVLNYDPLATQFANGTVYQAILSSQDYHRWHSPVKGRVAKAYVVPGAYYAAIVDKDPDVDVITRSIAFQSAICTRAIIFIEADNADIGMLCFVGVGLVEVSTCKLAVREGDRVEKGTEIGSFHFGGSTHLLILRPETKVKLLPKDAQAVSDARWVNTPLFEVLNGGPTL